MGLLEIKEIIYGGYKSEKNEKNGRGGKRVDKRERCEK